MITSAYGKLYNQGGELVAEGTCQVDDERGSVTIRPPYEMPLLERQHGMLRLELEDGSELTLSDRVLRFRVSLPGAPSGNLYRLTFTTQQRLTEWPRDVTSPRHPDDIPPEFRR